MGPILYPALTHATLEELLQSSAPPSPCLEKWANHLASNLPPRGVARINELIMLEEHFELWMKDIEEQGVVVIMHN